MKKNIAAALTALAAFTAQGALADDASCKTVRFADVGWSDIAATTGMASVVLEGLGYKPTGHHRLRPHHLCRDEEKAD